MSSDKSKSLSASQCESIASRLLAYGYLYKVDNLAEKILGGHNPFAYPSPHVIECDAENIHEGQITETIDLINTQLGSGYFIQPIKVVYTGTDDNFTFSMDDTDVITKMKSQITQCDVWLYNFLSFCKALRNCLYTRGHFDCSIYINYASGNDCQIAIYSMQLFQYCSAVWSNRGFVPLEVLVDMNYNNM